MGILIVDFRSNFGEGKYGIMDGNRRDLRGPGIRIKIVCTMGLVILCLLEWYEGRTATCFVVA